MLQHGRPVSVRHAPYECGRILSSENATSNRFIMCRKVKTLFRSAKDRRGHVSRASIAESPNDKIALLRMNSDGKAHEAAHPWKSLDANHVCLLGR